VPLLPTARVAPHADGLGAVRREDLDPEREPPPGRQVVREGDPGERFYLVLSGIFAVSQEDLGPRRVLQPGDYFGEVALAMNVPRTASVRALTPAVVASCDRETFDELLRPLFAED